MLKKILSLSLLSIIVVSSFVSAIEYEICDIGTLQTHSSQATAINNQGQILGWYNVDGTREGKHFFVRNRDGSFHEVPGKENGNGLDLDWRYLTNNGVVYGVYAGTPNNLVLFVWDQKNGVVKLGNLPGKEISAINDAGQVLIKSVAENEGGKSIRRPVIWQNGKITKLKGLEGEVGIESEESYGFDMNNQGDVVGQSVVYLSYKNNLYKETHATKWINGQVSDLYRTSSKNGDTSAIKINDIGDIILETGYLVRNDGAIIGIGYVSKASNSKYFISGGDFMTRLGERTYCSNIINGKLYYDYSSIWMSCNQIVDMNDNGEIIAKGKTIYGEEHAMLLVPVKAN